MIDHNEIWTIEKASGFVLLQLPTASYIYGHIYVIYILKKEKFSVLPTVNQAGTSQAN